MDQQGTLEVSYFQTFGPKGETVLDPVLAELFFVAKWRKLPLHLNPCRYPHIKALGTLPAGVGGAFRGIVRRTDLLSAVAALDADVYGKKLDPTDKAFCSLLDSRVGEAVCAILWGDAGVWEDYTYPTVSRSAPLGRGWYLASTERQRQQRGLALKQSQNGQTAFLGLRGALEALAARLGSDDTFGSATGRKEAETLSALDSRVYGHLSVLFSIPCEPSSPLQKMLQDFPTLAQFCDRMELRYSAWPSSSSFLASLPCRERAPAAAALLSATTGDGAQLAAPPANVPAKVRLEWWDLWGWSLGSRRRPPQAPGRRAAPPVWQAYIFGASAAASIVIAVLLGLGPAPLVQKLRAGASTRENIFNSSQRASEDGSNINSENVD